jgi:hypothetical protein
MKLLMEKWNKFVNEDEGRPGWAEDLGIPNHIVSGMINQARARGEEIESVEMNTRGNYTLYYESGYDEPYEAPMQHRGMEPDYERDVEL